MKKLVIISLLAAWFYLCMCVIVKAQTAIYRSVQPNNTSAIATNGIGTLTISGSTATFSAALPDSVGIGCVIQYDANSDNTVDNLAFIHGRTSSTVFTVKDSLGAAPNAVTNDDSWSIFHAYTNIFNWEAGTENTGIDAVLRNFDPGNRNISTVNEQWFVCLYRGTFITSTPVTIDWTTGAPGTNNKINIFPARLASEVGISQFHEGKFFGGFRHVYNGGSNSIFFIDVRNIVIDGFVVHDSSAGGATVAVIDARGVSAASSEIFIKNMIIKGHSNSPGVGYAILSGFYLSADSRTTKISNCYIFRALGASGSSGIANTQSPYTTYAFNNSVHNSIVGIRRTSGTMHIKNNIVNETTTADYSGTFSTTEYNASQDATASGTGSRTNQTFSFTNANGGDLSLTASDAGAKDFGTDLSGDANLPTTDDIVGTFRPQGSAYDIGAFEFQVESSGRRRWIVQSMLPEVKILLLAILITSLAGTVVGIYWHFFNQRKNSK